MSYFPVVGRSSLERSELYSEPFWISLVASLVSSNRLLVSPFIFTISFKALYNSGLVANTSSTCFIVTLLILIEQVMIYQHQLIHKI